MLESLLNFIQQKYEQPVPSAEKRLNTEEIRGLLDSKRTKDLDIRTVIIAVHPKGYTLNEAGFIPKLIQVSNKLDVTPEQLLGAISLETKGTFRPDIKNKFSSASGLIQILDSTAKELGTTTDKIRKMSGTEQLDIVEKFLLKSKKKFPKTGATNSDVYMAIFRPASVGKSENSVLYRKGGKRYKVNKSLDPDNLGYITKRMAGQIMTPHITKAKKILSEYKQRKSPP